MIRIHKIIIFLFALLVALGCYAQTLNYQMSVATSKAYPLSMGGAFATMEHPFAALDYNPAGINLQTQNRNQLFVFYNPFGVAAISRNWDDLKSERFPAEWVIRGAGLKLGRLSMACLFGEERIDTATDYYNNEFLQSTGYHDAWNGSFGFSLVLAPRVILGAAAETSYQEDVDNRIQWGYRYGLILKPKSYFTFGLSYLDLPNDHGDNRIPLERLADESLNIGFVFKPVNTFKLAVDVRNVSNPSDFIAQEPHVGVELIPWRHLALRGGYYQILEGRKDNFSMGIGLFDISTLVPHQRRLNYSTLGINVTYLIQRDAIQSSNWLIFSSSFYF